MKLNLFLWFMISLSFNVSCYAGSQSGGQSQFSIEEIALFSKRVEKFAAQKQALVFIVSRVGRPKKELPKDVQYTHTAFAVYSEMTSKDGKKLMGYTMYNLYQKDDDLGKSQLAIDFPVDFFAPVHSLEAGIIIPTPQLQQRLLEVLSTDQWKKVHISKYSVLAHPHHPLYQNCTEYVLDVINAAVYKTNNRKQLKANARAHFTPQKININPIKLLFGSLFSSGVSLRDQKKGISIATFNTISRYMHHYQLAQETVHMDALGQTF